MAPSVESAAVTESPQPVRDPGHAGTQPPQPGLDPGHAGTQPPQPVRDPLTANVPRQVKGSNLRWRPHLPAQAVCPLPRPFLELSLIHI